MKADEAGGTLGPASERRSYVAAAANRVPHIILSYWVIKIASTTLGETGADMFSMTLGLGYGATIGIFFALFAALLGVKLAVRRYTPTSYWAVFTASAILGTVISDFIDRTLGLGYAAGSALLTVLLLVTLAIWHRTERSLSVERIETARAEIFYWLAFLIANTLGTAAGDFLSDELGIGFMHSAALIAGLLLLTALGHYFTKLSSVLLFWVAFVLTRPFGATFGDLLTKPADHGGLALGTYSASAFFALLMAIALWRERSVEAARASSVRLTG
ncbi:MAG: hypothetical protein R3B13_27540 [Polyangiaceae bacterium]